MMQKILGIIALLLIVFLALTTTHSYSQTRVITTSFPYLGELIKKIASENWSINTLVPPGVDPHDYSLTARDIEFLKKSEIIVVTNHTFFEQRIIEMVNNNELKPKKLIIVEEINGLRFLLNPETLKPNFHLPYYDPDNLLALMKELKNTLEEVDPYRKELYQENFAKIHRQISNLKENYAYSMKEKAVGSTPLVQYAVNWLGVELTDLLIPEHGSQLSPKKQIEIEEKINKKEITVVVIRVTSDGEKWKPTTQYDEYLMSLATRKNLKLILVPDPLTSSQDLISNLEIMVTELLMQPAQKIDEFTPVKSRYEYLLPAMIGLIMIMLVILKAKKSD